MKKILIISSSLRRNSNSDALADVVARRVSGRLLDDIAEIVGRHAEFVGAILHCGQANGILEAVF